MAQRALAKGLSKAAIIHVPVPYAREWPDSFEAAFVDGGGTVTDKIEYVEGQASYVDMLTDVFANDPDTIALRPIRWTPASWWPTTTPTSPPSR